MTHRILVLGGGYAGLLAANRLALRLPANLAEITLVNDSELFVERVRLHQLAAGQTLRRRPLRELVNGAELVIGKVGAIDTARRQVRVDVDGVSTTREYDSLVYALGSGGPPGVTGMHGVATEAQALRLRAAVPVVADAGGSLAVIGGGATGVELATELAESYPNLRVELLDEVTPGHWLSLGAQRHLRSAFDRLGVRAVPGSRVAEVTTDAVTTSDGRRIPADLAVWAGGMRVPTLAAETGLEVDAVGRVPVDGALRALSHPEVLVVGDAAATRARDGALVRMGCGAGIPIAFHAANALADRLLGRTSSPLRFRYYAQNLSLGRRDGVIQFVGPDDQPHSATVTGRAGAYIKEQVVRGAIVAIRRPGVLTARGKRSPHLSSSDGVYVHP
jgi:NADH dehydrogenase FAD-containing subunit